MNKKLRKKIFSKFLFFDTYFITKKLGFRKIYFVRFNYSVLVLLNPNWKQFQQTYALICEIRCFCRLNKKRIAGNVEYPMRPLSTDSSYGMINLLIKTGKVTAKKKLVMRISHSAWACRCEFHLKAELFATLSDFLSLKFVSDSTTSGLVAASSLSHSFIFLKLFFQSANEKILLKVIKEKKLLTSGLSHFV